MKLKSLIFVCCLALFANAFAGNRHMHPKANTNEKSQQQAIAKNGATSPRYCEIEIINDLDTEIKVKGVFDDGSPLDAFIIYSHEVPHYISLYYYGACHQEMYLSIDAWDWRKGWYNVYSRYTQRRTSILVRSYLNSNAKVEVSKK